MPIYYSSGYYVYAYIREDGTPYYIGKGKDKRAFSNHNNIKVPKDKSRVIFLESNLTEIGAYALERRMIRWFGRKGIDEQGILYNVCAGGEGLGSTSGLKWFNNGETNILTKECPKDFVPGLLNRRGLKLCWFNDGKTDVFREECPDGFVPGRLKNSLRWFNNGKVSTRARVCPNGFVPGMLRNTKWFNNGIIDIQSDICPEGFVPGRKTATNKDCKWYNNGKVNVMKTECPVGFVSGRITLPSTINQ